MGACQIANYTFWEKNPQVHLIIIREWPKNNLLILRSLDNFSPGACYSTLLQLGTEEYVIKLEIFVSFCLFVMLTSKMEQKFMSWRKILINDLKPNQKWSNQLFTGCFSINVIHLEVNSSTNINDIIQYFSGLIDSRRLHGQWKKKHFV